MSQNKITITNVSSADGTMLQIAGDAESLSNSLVRHQSALFVNAHCGCPGFAKRRKCWHVTELFKKLKEAL